MFEEKQKKNGVNDGEKGEVNIFGERKETGFQKKCKLVELSGSFRKKLLKALHFVCFVNFIFILRQNTNKISINIFKYKQIIG